MIHIGIIGLGAIGQRLIGQFQKHQEVEIVAVCDQVESLAKDTAEKLGRVEAYKDYKELITDSRVDLVYVAVPPKFHHEIVMNVLDTKKHVLCEKPLANSLAEAKEMYEKAKQVGVIHAMNFPLNYGQAAVKFSELVKEDYIGKLRRLQLTMRFPEWPRFWQKNEWVASREQGGYVLEVGVHFIQQTLKIFGELTNVHTQLELPEDPTKCETGIIATAKLSDGTPVLIEGLSNVPGEELISYTAYGTDGVLSLNNWGELQGGKIGESLQEIAFEDANPNSLIDELVKAINGKEAELYDFEVGYKAQEVLEKLRKVE
ncbi:Gfo/Idh/MocA family protein [Bacillaceae bacterium W0354]